MAEFRTHYDNLQVARNASEAVIRAAYRILTQKHHPDKNPEDVETAHARIKIINRAYEVLSDPRQRAEYDSWVSQQEAENTQSDSIARERELLMKQQELARRVRQEERRRQQAEDELEKLRTEYLKEKAMVRQRVLTMVPALAAARPAPEAQDAPQVPARAAPVGAWTLNRRAAVAAAAIVVLAGYFGASRFMGDDRPPGAGPAPAAAAPTPAANSGVPAVPHEPAAKPALAIERHASRKQAEQAIAAGGAKPWDDASIASLERNQMWGPNLQGGSDNFFIKIRNETDLPLNGVLFELSDQPCDSPRGAKLSSYLFRFPKPLEGRQSASYPGKIELNADYAKNPSGMCGSIVSAW